MSLYSNVDAYLGNNTGCRTAAVVAPLLPTNSPMRCEAVLHDYGTSLVHLFYTIATVFKLYHDGDMTHEMRRRKLESTLFPTQGIINFPHRIVMA